MEVTRKLASVRQVANIVPIDGADFIEMVQIDGWECVAKKGEFKVNDKCVYFEIDSFLPVREEFEFLRKNCYKKLMTGEEGFRVRTVKLRKQVSQGLAMPLSLLGLDTSLELDTDVTEILQVIKYELPMWDQVPQHAKGKFPDFITKTDQERIQNIWGKITSLNETYEVSLKLDGSSMTVYHKDGYVGVCSRNLDLKMDMGGKFVDTAVKLGLPGALASYGKNIAIQGELMGPAIQKNRENFSEYKFFVFDVFDIDKQTYLLPKERLAVLDSLDVKLDHVPVRVNNLDFNQFNTIKDVLEYVDVPSINNPIAEGFVFKSTINPSNSFKVINNKYLLKCEE